MLQDSGRDPENFFGAMVQTSQKNCLIFEFRGRESDIVLEAQGLYILYGDEGIFAGFP